MGNPLLCDLFVFVSRPGCFPEDGSIRFIILFPLSRSILQGIQNLKNLKLTWAWEYLFEAHT